jgi:hypothetical protein
VVRTTWYYSCHDQRIVDCLRFETFSTCTTWVQVGHFMLSSKIRDCEQLRIVTLKDYTLYSLHLLPEVLVGKSSPFSVCNCTELFGNTSRIRYGPSHTASNLLGKSSFLASCNKTNIPDHRARFLCFRSKRTFRRRWIASMC